MMQLVGGNVHGGTFLAMAGKDSVVLLSDSRFSTQKTGSMLLGSYPRQTIRIGSKCLIGCFGLESDAKALLHKLRKKFTNIPESAADPASVSRVTSDILYESNYVLSPLVAGLSSSGEPYLCTMDSLGAETVSKRFAVTGSATEGLLAICESFYAPGLEATELVGLAEHCFAQAMQRDVMSGCNYRVITVTKDAIYLNDRERLDV
jgi:20S proteasome subunit beta 3